MVAPTLEEILACPKLPSLPAVALEVLELARDRYIKLEQIAQVVQQDQALTAKILKTVNSSFYGLAKPCPSIQRALAYLGLNTVKSLVLGFSLVDVTSGTDEAFDLMSYWRRSLYAAAGARRVASLLNCADPDDAFVAALMQDLGMLATRSAAPEFYDELLRQAGPDHRRLSKVEHDALGFDHAEIGALLAERWRLPPELVTAIRHHHDMQAKQHVALARTTTLGFECARTLTPPSSTDKLTRLADEWFRLSRTAVTDLLQELTEDAVELGRLFNVQTGVMPDVQAILAQADEVAIAHQFELDREREELEKTNDELSRQATTDGLTSVGNRKRFDDELATRFEQARSFKGSLGLIIADADKFKVLNDTYGHQAGDAVLIDLAARFAAAIRSMDVVCRYGGEEFAIILPGAAKKEVAAIAERLRRQVEATPFDMASVPGVDEAISVTVSLGAACLDRESNQVFTAPGILVQAADKALYAAKGAGRNCVRVFRPAGRSAAA